MGSRAARNLLAARTVESAKPRGREFYLRDGGGLFVRVYPSGLKRACYRFDDALGRTRRIEHAKPFGKGDAHLSLEQARAWRDELTELRLRGVDPVAATLALRRANALRVARRHDRRRPSHAAAGATPIEPRVYAPGSFGAIANEFHARVIVRSYRDPSQVRRILDSDLLPDLGALPVATLRLTDVQIVLNRIVDRGSPVAANRVLLVAKKVFRYARSQGHVDVNPLADVSRRDVGGREGERERALGFDEVATFWRALQAAEGLSWQVRACLQLLVLTGQRIGETLAATWSDVDLATGEWHLPAETTKSGRPHLVHLPSLAGELMQSLPKPKVAEALVFHADGNPRAQIERRSVTRALNRMLRANESIAPFSPHDLRRTVRSRLADLGVLPHVAEKILAHKLGGVLQVYDRAEYLPERAQAMQAWDSKLRELLGLAVEPRLL